MIYFGLLWEKKKTLLAQSLYNRDVYNSISVSLQLLQPSYSFEIWHQGKHGQTPGWIRAPSNVNTDSHDEDQVRGSVALTLQV